MKTKFLLLIACFLTINTINAQKEGNVWCFGEQLSVNFNPDVPFVENNSSMSTIQGASSICDASGNLLFYSNGGDRVYPGSNSQDHGIIWNKNHNILYDMGLLEGGGQSGRQTSIALPKPGVPNHYYLFTLDDREARIVGNSKGLSYFEIDMNQNGGLGGVVGYQHALISPAEEALSACIHANGQDFWVAVINYTTVAVNVFSVNSTGVNFATAENLPTQLSGDYEIKFSPDGSKIMVGETLFDFDNTTGQVSNPIPLPDMVYGCSFSPNSQYLYSVFSDGYSTQVRRYDVTASNVPASRDTIANMSGSNSQMQVAPDGNIYFFSGPWPTHQLSVVQCPNSLTPCVRPTLSSLFPGPIKSFPNFTDHIFANQAIGDTRPVEIQASSTMVCPGDTVSLALHVTPDYSFQWSDGSTSSSIQVYAPGNYSVTIDDGCCNVKSSNIIISGKTSVDQVVNEDDIKIFPNPTEGEIYFEYTSELGAIQEVEILNIESKMMARRTGNNIQKIDIQDLSAGMYIIRLKTENNQVVNKRILKH